MRKLTILVCMALVFGMLAAACAKPPTEEMNNAVEAVTRAENNIDAVTYAGNTIARAKDALARMQSEAASKRYDSAKSYAQEAIAAAERAITEGRTGAARARDEASTLVTGLVPLVEETSQRLETARRARLPLDFSLLDLNFSRASDEANRAQEAFYANRYQDAISLGRAARSELTDINQTLTNAAAASTQRK